MNFDKQEDINIRQIQEFHLALDREKDFDADIVRNVAYLTAEVGETMNAIRDLKKAGSNSDTTKAKERVGQELADCLAYIAKLANYANIDLQEAYRNKMGININRRWK